MPNLLIERFEVPESHRGERALDYARRRATDALGDCHVWFVSELELAGDLQADDVVVLPEHLQGELARGARERGAHVVVHAAFGPLGSREEAWGFICPYADCVDAYVWTWGENLAWRTMLADVIENHHVQNVGGTRGARPTVAAR
jgi:hypothetical protein